MLGTKYEEEEEEEVKGERRGGGTALESSTKMSGNFHYSIDSVFLIKSVNISDVLIRNF